MLARLLLIVLVGLLAAGCRGRQVRDDAPPTVEASASATAVASGEDGLAPITPTGDLPQTTLDIRVDHEDSIAFAQAWRLDTIPVEGYEVPVVVNDEVIRWMIYFTTGAQGTFERWLSRSTRFRDMMEMTLAEEGMPIEMVYLAMIESGFQTEAVSHARACGLWQFMAPTGRQMELCVDRYLDERFDPEAATRAAARYLQYLFNRFGDWHLVMAAYNGGEGRVGGAMKRTGLTDYWSLCRAGQLPKETCEYVPRFLAALVLSENAAHFGFEVLPQDPWDYDRVAVPGGVALELVADCSGAECEQVEALNPQLRRPFTPPGEAEYLVRVPKGSADGFAEKFAAIPKEQLKGAIHVIGAGETLSHIAHRYGVTVDDLMRANGIRDPRRLQIGQELTVPGTLTLSGSNKTAKASSRRAAGRKKSPQRPSGPSTAYTVRSGDSLWGIANRYGVSVGEIKQWNGLTSDALSIGQSLRIYGSFGVPGGTHAVLSGESLWTISRAYGVSVSQLKTWNGLHSDALSVGQILKVGPSGGAKKGGAASRYVVRSGDSLWSVANKHKVSVADLRGWNSLASDALSIGQVLLVYGAPPAAERGSSAAKATYHTVSQGESLWAVSQRYGVDLSTLRKLNNLRSDTVYPGDRLKLSP